MIQERLLLQKRELEARRHEKYVPRDIGSQALSPYLINVILGPRRAGKSTFAIHALHEPFGYVNFDDEKLAEVQDYDEIIAAVDALYDTPMTLLFDEIQNLPRWELFVNRLQRQGRKLIITGSNAHLLSKELATHLTGRHLPVILFPFSFSEFLKRKGSELMVVEKKSLLEFYLINGGYPEPLLKDTASKEYISTLFTSIIYKDIMKRFSLRIPQAVEDLALYLVANVSQEFSYNTLRKIAKCNSVHTIDKYLSYLEEAFLFFQVKKFSFKAREQLTHNKKMFCIDNGFITAKAFQTSTNYGQLYENIAAIHLKRSKMMGKLDFYYWKNSQQEEVDFVIKQGLKITQLIQVCYELEREKTKEREIRALLKAGKELKCKDLLIITKEREGTEAKEWFGVKGTVRYIPLWKWLLQKS